ncbi:MAG: zinc ribbon domain-containing protein [Clostridiales bacterium]|nr:zinc ribbon domain-containing protein [Clostridiales bacterium]
MRCTNCGAELKEGAASCPYCGYSFGTNNGQNYAPYQYQQPPYQQPPYQQPQYQQYPMQEPVEKVTSIGQYIGWSVLAHCLGLISLIICIVFACMGEQKNRANFFRAQLIVWLVLTLIIIIAAVIFTSLGFGFAAML